jgi:Zn-dependent peptidase ImmA (M78 family)
MLQQPPVGMDAIIERAGVPVVERVLVDAVRGTIGDVAGRRTIILNRRHRFSTKQERRWALAEELGHVLLGHSPRPSAFSGVRECPGH